MKYTATKIAKQCGHPLLTQLYTEDKVIQNSRVAFHAVPSYLCPFNDDRRGAYQRRKYTADRRGRLLLAGDYVGQRAENTDDRRGRLTT